MKEGFILSGSGGSWWVLNIYVFSEKQFNRCLGEECGKYEEPRGKRISDRTLAGNGSLSC